MIDTCCLGYGWDVIFYWRFRIFANSRKECLPWIGQGAWYIQSSCRYRLHDLHNLNETPLKLMYGAVNLGNVVQTVMRHARPGSQYNLGLVGDTSMLDEVVKGNSALSGPGNSSFDTM